MWNSLNNSEKCIHDLVKFKEKINIQMKPQKIKFYKHGCKYGNKLITSLRVGQSYLNAHSFKIGLCQTPECDCGARQETSSHILLDCEFYVSDRQILFDFVGTQLSCFPKLGKKEKN